MSSHDVSAPAGPDSRDALPAICLNMIVRNEAHIVREVLDSVAPYISAWVIVDTGSDDGTQDVIRSHTAELGIPGEIHERPWQNFGVNRSEALDLAQGHGDFIWVIDADDLVKGNLDLTPLTTDDADVYELRFGDGGFTYWRPQLLRDGLPWRYAGVVHEYLECERPIVRARLEGDYSIHSRRLGGRNLDPLKYARDRDLLLAEMERDPDDSRSAFYLAQSYFDLRDFANSRIWYGRRAAMGGFDQEVYYSKLRVAEAMSWLDEPWPEVQDAYLQAWAYRPSRAEGLHAIARRYRTTECYQLGYLFAERAAQIPLPHGDGLFVDADVHNWRAVDEQAICAAWIGRGAESFDLCRKLLNRRDLPDADRSRISGNRDLQVPILIGVASTYSHERARILSNGQHGDVAISLVAGPDRATTERILNSFLNTCSDLTRVGRFLLVHSGLPAEDRVALIEKYRFLDFIQTAPGDLGRVRQALQQQRFWLDLGLGWQFFAQEPVITRMTEVLATEPEVFQVALNLDDATKLTGISAAENAVRRTSDDTRYVLTDAVANGPAMFDVARLDQAGGFCATDGDPLAMLGKRSAAAGLRTATLDEVLAVRMPGV